VESLRPGTVLRRAPELELRITPAGDILVDTEQGPVSGGPHCLAILDHFAQPATLAEALDALGARAGGRQDWIDLSAAIVRLHEMGALHADDEPERDSRHRARSTFDSPGPHVAMLEDRVRTTAFLAALEELVGPDDVVVDIGTGTGVLAIGAARAGARHVYAVEATPLAQQAREIVRANGLHETVTVVEGWSTRITLPERASLAVAEILGSEALEERALPALLDVRERLLRPGARLIPSKIQIFGLPVSIPEDAVGMLTFTPANTARWSSWYGLELGPLTDYAARLRHRVTARIEEARTWPALSDPVLLAEIDLATVVTPSVESVVSAAATASGEANGILAFFEARLSPGVVLSTNPAAEDGPTSWGIPVWLLPKPTELHPGRTFSLAYTYSGGGGHVRLAD
jgi:precorrin-6B methylase 2